MTPFLGLLRPVYLHCSTRPPLLMQHFRPTLAFKSLIPLLPVLSHFPLLPHHRLLLLAVLLSLLLPLPPDFLRVLQWNADGLQARRTELLHFLSSHPVDLTSVSRKPIFTHLPPSRSLDSLLCDLIAPTPGLAFSLLMPRTLAATSTFSSGKAYSSLNFLPPLFLFA